MKPLNFKSARRRTFEVAGKGKPIAARLYPGPGIDTFLLDPEHVCENLLVDITVCNQPDCPFGRLGSSTIANLISLFAAAGDSRRASTLMREIDRQQLALGKFTKLSASRLPASRIPWAHYEQNADTTGWRIER